jgi:hypothetical protein
VKWTTPIDKCDKPSLAGGVTPCGTASRLSRTERENVEWIALARKTKGPEPLAAEQYWSQDDSSYALLGYIGFNRVAGEVAFFDGTYEGMKLTGTHRRFSLVGMATRTARDEPLRRRHMIRLFALTARRATTTKNPT